jgi:hypothetical protein
MIVSVERNREQQERRTDEHVAGNLSQKKEKKHPESDLKTKPEQNGKEKSPRLVQAEDQKVEKTSLCESEINLPELKLSVTEAKYPSLPISVMDDNVLAKKVEECKEKSKNSKRKSREGGSACSKCVIY